MLMPQCQQSAIISQKRIDIGALQSGQAHIKTSPFIQMESAWAGAVGAEGWATGADSGTEVLDSPAASGSGASEVRSTRGMADATASQSWSSGSSRIDRLESW
jgi:hypothetical protein